MPVLPLFERQKRRALNGMVKVIVVSVSGKCDGRCELDPYFHAVIAFHGQNYCVGRYAVFRGALAELILHPRRVVSLRAGDVNVVLHQILEEIGLVGYGNKQITDVSHQRNNCNNDNELKPRTSAFSRSCGCIHHKFLNAPLPYCQGIAQ